MAAPVPSVCMLPRSDLLPNPSVSLLMKPTPLFIFYLLLSHCIIASLGPLPTGWNPDRIPSSLQSWLLQPLPMPTLQGVLCVHSYVCDFINTEAAHFCARQTILLTASCPFSFLLVPLSIILPTHPSLHA